MYSDDPGKCRSYASVGDRLMVVWSRLKHSTRNTSTYMENQD
jgi:hypothetical protein